jgi:membrane protein DedA with SNARE-associated domain
MSEPASPPEPASTPEPAGATPAPEPAAAVVAAEGRREPVHKRHRLAMLLSVVAVHHGLALAGTVFFAALVTSAPALLLALSSRNRHLLLVVPAGIWPVAYVVVPILRIGIPAVAYYLLGAWYGERGLAWLEREAGGRPSTIRWAESLFDKVGAPLLVLAPASNIVQLLAGHRGMRPRQFGLLLALGIALKLGFFWFLGEAFEEPLQRLLDWIQRYQWWIVAAFLVWSVVDSSRQVRRTMAQKPPEEFTVEEPLPEVGHPHDPGH